MSREHSFHKFFIKNLLENKFQTASWGINLRTGGEKISDGFKGKSTVYNGVCVCVCMSMYTAYLTMDTLLNKGIGILKMLNCL